MASGSSYKLHLVVIGAGLAGLAAAITTAAEGHKVTLLEKVHDLREVGAGLQVTPNATRLLKHWGVYEELEPLAAAPSALTVWRYDGTRILAREPSFQEKIMAQYDSPFWDLHRVDLQRALVARTQSLGVHIRLDSDITEIDFSATTAILAGGERITGDVILAADGLWSNCRALFLGKPSPPLPTGDLAYRIILHKDEVDDPELRAWIEKPTVTFWAGPYSHVVAYSIRAGKTFNLVLICPDDLPDNVSRAEGNVEEMKKLFAGWDPMLSRFLACVKAVDKWKLMHLNALEQWKSDTSNFVLAGDACHPMLPYLAQGANSSLEDGAVLGKLLGHVQNAASIPKALGLYQEVRKVRGETLGREAIKQRESFHMPDGKEQQERDRIFDAYLRGEPVEDLPSRWASPTVQPWLYGYDAFAAAEAAFETQPF